MKTQKENFSKLNKNKKIQFIMALFITLALFVAAVSYAWFALSGKLETLTKVKEPESMDIRAGGSQPDPIVNFDLSDIDITKVQTSPQMRVFTVSPGDYKMRYKLQLAYTTNIPFTYTIYTAVPATKDDYQVAYLKKNDTEANTYYYNKGSKVEMKKKNLISDLSYYGRDLGDNNKSDKYYKDTYDANKDTPELYAVPVYEQSENITPGSNDNGYDYYILEISWKSETAGTNFTEWNEAVNKKETDMVYITATRSTN